MSDDRSPKSAFELAMEKLKARDRERGDAPPAPLTDAQKRAIAEARAEAKAELAQWEILKTKRLAEAAADPATYAETVERLDIDRKRIDAALESKIRRIRRGEEDTA